MKHANFEETIAGIATAPGEAGVAILRLSGQRSIALAEKIFLAKNAKPLSQQPNRHLTYGWIMEGSRTIDEVLCVVMKGPYSFTTEDVVEIHCHGGSYIAGKILALLLKQGARLAQPGEFTQRAFVHGRIDLTQAEAIGDLVKTRTALGLDLVINQLKGKLYLRIKQLNDSVSWALALVNAGIDFPEEDVVFSHREQIAEKLAQVHQSLSGLVEHADQGIIIREGFQVVLAGQPNVGKSSLMNALLGVDRAIVTHVAGTTRDTIEESLSLEGIPVSLVDTAGIRATADLVEQQGIERSLMAMSRADLVLWVVDACQPNFNLELPESMHNQASEKLLVINKMDLAEEEPSIPEACRGIPRLYLSAKLAPDIQRLKEEIFQFLAGKRGKLSEDSLLTNLRQKTACQKALVCLEQSQQSLTEQAGDELLAADLSQVLDALGEVVGETTPDDMLNSIFANFCIGK